MIPLKNTTRFNKMFTCLCSNCKEQFVIVVEPKNTGYAICPRCQSEKIFIDEDGDKNGDYLYS
jgi:hypothetical protein